jgi:D-glycero-D-manno-heptose 1,7-bisphosphate phosphatase
MIQKKNSSPPTQSDYIVDTQQGVLSFRRLLQGHPGLMPAVFLDRDGVVNRHIPGEYVTRWAEFEILPGVPTALRRLRRAGFRLVIVSNQAAVPKGLLKRDELIRITDISLKKFGDAGADVDGAFFCLHHPNEDCSCRKPKPGLLRVAAHFFPTDFSKSFLIGDSIGDILAGAAMACRTIYLAAKPDASVPATHQARSLSEAVRWIISDQTPDSDEPRYKRSTRSQ